GRGGRGRAAQAQTQSPQSGQSTQAQGAQSQASAPTGRQGGQDQANGEAGGGRGGQAGGGGESRGFDPARMMDGFKALSPDEQSQCIARMKERGRDTSAFEQAKSGSPTPGKPGKAPAPSKPGTGLKAQSAQTIDALFAPLPPVESRGRAWLFADRQMKSV